MRYKVYEIGNSSNWIYAMQDELQCRAHTSFDRIIDYYTRYDIVFTSKNFTVLLRKDDTLFQYREGVIIINEVHPLFNFDCFWFPCDTKIIESYKKFGFDNMIGYLLNDKGTL